MNTVIKLYVISIFLIFSLSAVCQSKQPETELILVLEEPPSFPGGDKALFNFINSNKTYPNNWRVDSIKGKVYITFLIDSTGSIQNPKIVRGLNPNLDSIAIMIIRKMPKWSPGKQRNKPVAVQFNLPITFGSENKKNK